MRRRREGRIRMLAFGPHERVDWWVVAFWMVAGPSLVVWWLAIGTAAASMWSH